MASYLAAKHHRQHSAGLKKSQPASLINEVPLPLSIVDKGAAQRQRVVRKKLFFFL